MNVTQNNYKIEVTFDPTITYFLIIVINTIKCQKGISVKYKPAFAFLG